MGGSACRDGMYPPEISSRGGRIDRVFADLSGKRQGFQTTGAIGMSSSDQRQYTEHEFRQLVCKLANDQIRRGAKYVKCSIIEATLFRSIGGNHYKVVSEILDEFGFPRIKVSRRKPIIVFNVANESHIQNVEFMPGSVVSPHVVWLDAQGVKQIERCESKSSWQRLEV
jgi:hypothetical protein